MSDEIYYGQLNFENLAFEGASVAYKSGYRGLVNGSPDTLAARELLYLQLRVSHAIRNNGNARIARDKFVTNLGFVEVKWKDKNKKEHKRMQDYWDEFCQDPSLDGYGSFRNVFDVWKHEFFHGSSFTRKHIRRSNNSNKIPLKLQTIPCEYHDVIFNGVGPEENIKHGIKFVDTKPEIYYFRPGIIEYDVNNQVNPYGQIAIPANEIIHIFIRERAGQWIGIPLLASVLTSLYELDELNDATVAKQKAAQAISWIIENTNPLAMTPAGVPTIVKDKDQNDKVVFRTNGGNVQYLNKGESIKFWQSTDIGANLLVLIQTELRKISATVGIPYYQLTGETNDLDFSSLRAIAIELRVRMEYILLTYFIPLGLHQLAMYFRELAFLYDRKLTNVFPYYQMPRWYGVDELKDGQSDLLEVQNGMVPLQRVLDERHTTFEEILESAKQIKILRENGIDITKNQNSSTQMNNFEPNSNSTGI